MLLQGLMADEIGKVGGGNFSRASAGLPKPEFHEYFGLKSSPEDYFR
jgi:hypothetical protein